MGWGTLLTIAAAYAVCTRNRCGCWFPPISKTFSFTPAFSDHPSHSHRRPLLSLSLRLSVSFSLSLSLSLSLCLSVSVSLSLSLSLSLPASLSFKYQSRLISLPLPVFLSLSLSLFCKENRCKQGRNGRDVLDTHKQLLQQQPRLLVCSDFMGSSCQLQKSLLYPG